MSRSRYRYDKVLKEVVPIPDDEELEVIHCGISYGREKLDWMKKNGYVPPSDFKHTLEKKAKERIGSRLPANTREWREERKSTIIEAYEKVKAGYRPQSRYIPELDGRKK